MQINNIIPILFLFLFYFFKKKAFKPPTLKNNFKLLYCYKLHSPLVFKEKISRVNAHELVFIKDVVRLPPKMVKGIG